MHRSKTLQSSITENFNILVSLSIALAGFTILHKGLKKLNIVVSYHCEIHQSKDAEA